ncbi:solute carrier family 23 member 3 [Chanos chanos]|uniref:Solute carrier family 23 member 3 n=1 Tax=Chanos chanos TaxID=29144 RepID=A0A6J2WDW0_CHACN|nr:solute carrier family 23 member 3 [Chanos chanos]
MFACGQSNPEDPGEAVTSPGFRVNRSPPCLMVLALAFQHVLVQSSMQVLVVGGVLQEREEMEKVLTPVFFYSGLSTLLQSCLGTRLPLIQAPSVEFMIPAMALLFVRTENNVTCRGHCEETRESVIRGYPLRELQGMVVVAGLVQLAVGLTGIGGAVQRGFGPMVIAPVLCMLGFSVYREAAILCSYHWGFAMLTVVLLVFFSQHLRSCVIPACLRLPVYPVCRMLSVLLSVSLVWGLCASLEHWGHIYFYPLYELHPGMKVSNTTPTLVLNDTNVIAPSAWFSFPLSGSGLPLLSGPAIAAGVAAALSVSISSQCVYMLTARLLDSPPPPAAATNRGLCAEGLGSVLAGLMGAPVGVCSSVANACSLGLSQCGSRSTVQVAGALLLIVGVSPKLAHLLTCIPLAIHGAVLSVTYTVAVGTGITYFQYTHMDSGRNIFNIGFTVFMALVLPRWCRLQAGLISTGVPSIDVILQSFMTLPIFLVGLLAFVLDHTVSGSLMERGLDRNENTKEVWSLANRQQGQSHTLEAVYEPPYLVKKFLNLPGLRVIPFCACRKPEGQEVVATPQEISSLLSV